jgi:hypothetical protein
MHVVAHTDQLLSYVLLHVYINIYDPNILLFCFFLNRWLCMATLEIEKCKT